MAVAPKSMAWQAKSLGQICQQIKDPKRNGGKTLAAILPLLLVTVLPAACHVEFVRAETDLVFEFLWVGCHGRGRFLRGICIHGGNSLEANVRLNPGLVNCPGMVQ